MEDIKKIEEILKTPCIHLLPSEKERTLEKTDEIRYRYHRVRRPVKGVKLEGRFRYTRKLSLSNELREAIAKSRRILELKDDWDDEGSPGYAEATLNRATSFLTTSALRYRRDHRKWIPAPRINPGPDGSIDLHWKSPGKELLINIPVSLEEPATYYGDDREDGTENAIRGKKLNTSVYNEWIIAWLMK